MDWSSTSVILTIVGSSLGVSTWFYKLLKDHMDQAIARLDKTITQLDSKVDNGIAQLDAKIDKAAAQLDTKIDKTAAQLDAKIDKTAAQLDAKIDKTAAQLDAKIEQAHKSVKHLGKELTDFRVEVGERMANIEGQITQMTRPNVIRIERDDYQGKRHDSDDALEN